MPIFAVVSKADKKPPEDVDDILAQVRQEITNTMGKPPFKVIKVSARKNDVGELVAAHGAAGFADTWLRHRGVAWAADMLPSQNPISPAPMGQPKE